MMKGMRPGQPADARPKQVGGGSKKHRRGLVRSLGLTGPVAEAFLDVPREVFVPEWVGRLGLAKIYEPQAVLVTQTDQHGRATSSSSAPAIMAPMLQALSVEPGHRVLEIGAGTGYNAALLQCLVGPKGSVTSVELDPELASRAKHALAEIGSRATVVSGDGHLGYARRAPYDRIIATAASPTVPPAWFDQLADGGLLEFPYQLVGLGAIPTLRKNDGRLESESVLLGGFMSMRGSVEEGGSSHNQLGVFESKSDKSRSESLLGTGLRRLNKTARGQLLHLLVEGPEVRPWKEADPIGYLLVGNRDAVQYAGHRGWGAGVAAPDGSAAAAVVRGSDNRRRVLTWGRDGWDLLEDSLLEWRRLGRPAPDRLRLTVTFGAGQPRLRHWGAPGAASKDSDQNQGAGLAKPRPSGSIK